MPEIAKVVPHAAAVLGNYKNHPTVTGFEGMKASRRTAEVWHCERPWKAIGKSVPSVVMDSPGLKGSCKRVEDWYHEERL